ncbi:MAG TPA: ethanolamine utilization microcompartment protein EutL [Anaerolineaceae bacterium]|nr:ethanolamine utilization microcompartment protein EutL [Anaerolineaceae bacterium]
MAILDPIRATPLAVRLISQVEAGLAAALNLRKDQRSLGLLTADNDDATYVAIDEATKMANVEVVYARSFYAGAKHASGPLSGEIIAMLAGPDPAEVGAGLNAALDYMQTRALWYSANADNSIAFFPHVISQTGSYLSKLCGIPLGAPLAYLVAPPLEGVYAMDAALKAAAVQVVSYTPPPSETNFMGVLLTGEQSACRAAAFAFQEAVLEVAARPILY